MRGYIYPPLIAFLFMPLTFVSVQTAALIMLFVNMTLVLCCAWLVATEVTRRFDIDTSFDSVILVVALTTLLSTDPSNPRLQEKVVF